MNLKDFLEARIAEDEQAIRRAPTNADAFDISQVPVTQALRDRLLAECEAKRKIIAISDEVLSMDHQITQEWGVGEGIDGTADDILHAFAAVYKDHPDYASVVEPEEEPQDRWSIIERADD